MAHFNRKHNSSLKNLWLDAGEDFLFWVRIFGIKPPDEGDCVWENREQLESYFIALCFTVILIPWKLPSYIKSRKLKDHRGAWWDKGEVAT